MTPTSNTLTSPPRFRFLYRRQTRLLIIWLSIVLLAVGYVVFMSLWQSSGSRLVSFAELLIPRSLDLILGSWLFFVGSSIGSFLNVVAWRMPRGMSVNGRSHCPWCDQTLSWKDNWPVLGWVALAGRCRTCRMPISPRYPIVELAVGTCILIMGIIELYGGGMSLPFHDDRWAPAGILWTPYVTNDNLLTITYHIVAISVAWALGLVRFDGHRLPSSLVFVSLALLLLPMLIYPGFAIVPWHVTIAASWQSDGRYLDAAMRIITGLAAAVLIGRSLSRYLSPTADPKLNPLGEGTRRLLDLIAMLAVPAVVVGWQAVFAVTVVSLLTSRAMSRIMPMRSDPLALLGIALPIILTLQISVWRWLHNATYWPSVNTAPMVILGWAAVLLLLPAVFHSKANRTEDYAGSPM